MLDKIKNNYKASEEYRCRFYLFFAFLLMLINGFAVIPLRLTFSTDIVFQETVLPVIAYLIEELFTYAAFLATLISTSVFCYLFSTDKKKVIRFGLMGVFISAAGALIDVFMTVAANSFRFRVLDTDDLISSLLKIFFEAVIIFTVIFVGLKTSAEHLRSSAIYAKSYRIATGLEYDEREGVFPFKKFYAAQNPVQNAIFWGVVVNFIIYILDSLSGMIILAIADSSQSIEASDYIMAFFEILFYAVLSIILYTAGYFGCRLFLKNKSRNTAEIYEVKND